jgi:phosphoribosylformylglycinamidine cyclo-ligase
VASTDSVGTKVKIAIAVRRHRGIGVDLVNHCLNDVITTGADPIFFLDYFATGRLVPEVLQEVIAGAAEACRAAGCALLGGETAEMPGLYALGDYDFAGFMVGSAPRARLLDPASVREGDLLLGMPSSGLHTNGYSLVREALREQDLRQTRAELNGATLADALLEPHRSYLDEVRALRQTGALRALAHITGGGIHDNLSRIVPEGLAAEIDATAWSVPPLFSLIRSLGGIPEDEMWRVFNMGVGMIAVVSEQQVNGSAPTLPVVGRIVRRQGPDLVRIRT